MHASQSKNPPPDATPRGYESASSYNIRKCSLDEFLATCFQPPYDTVSWTLLSHNHIMLVMRGFLMGAKWHLDADAERNLIFCDE